MSTQPQPVTPDEVLCVRKPKRMVHEYVEGASGRELYIYYGVKEICFDEPDMIPFGEGLVANSRFVARAAQDWSVADPHPWEKVRDLLEALLAEGIVVREAELEQSRRSRAPSQVAGEPAQHFDPANPPPAWSSLDLRCSVVSAEIFGRSHAVDHLEFVVPCYRVAHPAFDRDGRQVGERNVKPPLLRVDVPTEWRTCNYPGSRYQDDLPMNVSALKQMGAHWGQTLAQVAAARRHFVDRCNRSVDARIPVLDLEILANFILSVPACLLTRGRDPVSNGDLSPALASLFRVTDGVRFSVENMLLGVNDLPIAPDRELEPLEFLERVEQAGFFLGQHGVCAGPRPMVIEFLDVLMAGATPAGEPAAGPSLVDEVGPLDVPLTYALLSTRLEAEFRIFFARTAERVQTLGAALEGTDMTGCTRPHILPMIRRAADELGPASDANARTIRSRSALAARCAELAGARSSDPAAGDVASSLRDLFGRRHLDVGLPAAALDIIVSNLAGALADEHAFLVLANRLQVQINELLERPTISRPIDRRDLAWRMRTRVDRSAPIPVTTLIEEIFGLELSFDGTTVALAQEPRSLETAASPAPARPARPRELEAWFDRDVLDQALARYGADPGQETELPGFENRVYEFERAGEDFILRIAHSARRSLSMTLGEVEWVELLAGRGLPVARPVRSGSGKLAEIVRPLRDGSYFVATAFERAEGEVLGDAPALKARYWNPTLFRDWGKLTARLHRESIGYRPSRPLLRRPHWYEYDVLDVRRFVPDQDLVRARTDELIAAIHRLPRRDDSYGLIHADLTQFNFCLAEGRITVFDFDNCEQAWFVKDIAVASFYLAAQMRDTGGSLVDDFLDPFLRGYREHMTIDAEVLRALPLFLELQRIMNYTLFHQRRDPATWTDRDRARMAAIRHAIEESTPVAELDLERLCEVAA